jgi:hypothetical protein
MRLRREFLCLKYKLLYLQKPVQLNLYRLYYLKPFVKTFLTWLYFRIEKFNIVSTSKQTKLWNYLMRIPPFRLYCAT